MPLRLDWCSFDAAIYACRHWHYSKTISAGRLVKIGVWEHGKFIGAIIFGHGSNSAIGSEYGLTMFQACEITRIALDRHEAPVSKMVAIALRMLKSQSPGMRLVVSYADSTQNHHGGIYQATGWVYTGLCAFDGGIRLNGEVVHRRSLNSLYGTSDINFIRAKIDPRAEMVTGTGKHKYLYPLDEDVRRAVESLRKPYPKRATSIVGDVPPFQRGEGGSTPTVALLAV